LSWEYKEIQCDRYLSGERSEWQTKEVSEAKEERGRDEWEVVEIAEEEGCHLHFPSANFHTLLSVPHSYFTSLFHPLLLSHSQPRSTRESSRPLLTGHPLAGCLEIARREGGGEEDGGEKTEGGCQAG